MPWPNLVIFAAPRCGSSSLFTYLSDHPQAAYPGEKELQYFMDPDSILFRPERNFRDHGEAGYRAIFSRTPSADLVLEATPGYLYQETARHQVPALPGRPKLLAVLRRPEEQVYSVFHYAKHHSNILAEDVDFAEFVAGSPRIRALGSEFLSQPVANARYVEYLLPWREAAGRDRLAIVLLEDLQRDPRGQLEGLAGWLGIDSSFYADYGFDVRNPRQQFRWHRLRQWAGPIGRRLPRGRLRRRLKRLHDYVNSRAADGPDARDRAVMAELAEEFAPANRRLADAFGLDLAHWQDAVSR